MFVSQQLQLIVGIFFIVVTLRRAYPFKDNMPILIKSGESECICEKAILKSTNTCGNKSLMEFLKTFYDRNEYTQERMAKETKDLKSTTTTTTSTMITNNAENILKFLHNKECTLDSANDINWTDEDGLSSNEIISTKTGQKILLQFSNPDSDRDYIYNDDGFEILKNNLDICGGPSPDISYGSIAKFMEYPWIVLLLYDTDYHQCGGSLITTQYVLTAAHCVKLKYYVLTGVRLGVYDLTKEEYCVENSDGKVVCYTSVDAKVVKIIIHHDYTEHHFKNDIALLKLDKGYYNESYYPICIPLPDDPYTELKAMVAGWGLTENGSKSDILKKTEVPLLHMSKCRSAYPYREFNETTEICGAGVDHVGTCKGDSGGPLFYNESIGGDNKYYQLGVISMGGRGCAKILLTPQIFSNVTGFYTWIANNLE